MMAAARRRRARRVAGVEPQPASARPVSVAARRLGGSQISDMQRSRLLTAAVGAVEAFGCDGASVARITERANVSRRTFYELFENREQCLLAVLDSAIERVEHELAAADLGGLSWRERVRGGLWVILCFFDREPALAWMCVVESQRGGRTMLERRQRALDRLADVVDGGRGRGSRSSAEDALTAQGVVGGCVSILYARLLKARGEPLCDLLGQLMGMIVLPYAGAAAARREQTRAVPDLPPARVMDGEGEVVGVGDVLAGLPMRLTYRTARALEVLAEHPGSSNREIADLVGIADQGQISKLLARLARLGLLENGASGAQEKGEPNEWALTSTGKQVVRSIRAHSAGTQRERSER